MKIIAVSNHNLENVSDKHIASNLNKYYGELILALLQKGVGDSDMYWFKLVDDDYKLYTWEP